MVGGSLTAVAADETSRRPAVALAGKEREVADDHAELIQIPVQRFAIPSRLQHDVPKTLHPGGLSGGPLGRVGAPQLSPEVEGLRRLSRQRFELMSARYDANRHAAGIRQIHGVPANRLGQRARRRTVGVSQPQHIRLVHGDECGTDESRRWPAADVHTRRARIAATQLQLVTAARHGGEAERMRKRFGANQIRLLEFQPREIVDLDQRVRRPAAVLSFSRTLLAVDVAVSTDRVGHLRLLSTVRSRAISTSMSSWPPTIPRRPASSRRVRASMSYRAAADSACRRKLEYTPA